MAETGGQIEALAPLARWDPFRELERALGGWHPLESRVGRLLEELWGEPRRLGGQLFPPMSIHESESAYVITVDISGSKQEDVTVEGKDRVLTLTVASTEESKPRTMAVQS